MPGKKFLEKQEEALILALFLVLLHRPRRKAGLHHPLIKTNLAIERKKAVLINNSSFAPFNLSKALDSKSCFLLDKVCFFI